MTVKNDDVQDVLVAMSERYPALEWRRAVNEEGGALCVGEDSYCVSYGGWMANNSVIVNHDGETSVPMGALVSRDFDHCRERFSVAERVAAVDTLRPHLMLALMRIVRMLEVLQ